jgi:hypothetical protein
MKVSAISERSFFAKMLLLFALLLLGHAKKKGELGEYMKSMFKPDTLSISQMPSARLVARP